jgi:decaprenylphospho-beta-D-ribofuranose 2-oxidase
MRPELLPAMYSRLDEWRRVRAGVAPDGILQSDQPRRLGL